MNKAAMTSTCRFLWGHKFSTSLSKISREMCGKTMFNFARNHKTVFQSGGTIFHSHQQCLRVPRPHQHLMSVFQILDILIIAWWYLVVLIYIFWQHMMWNIFSYVYLPSVYFLWWDVCLLRSLVHFLIRLLVFLLWSFKSSLYMLDNNSLSRCVFYKYSLPVCGLSYSRILSFTEQTLLILMKSSWSVISFMDHVFCVASKKASLFLDATRKTRSSRFSFMSFSSSFVVCVLYLGLWSILS